MNDQTQVTHFLVETTNPELLDNFLQHLPNITAHVVGLGMPGGITYEEGYPVVKVFGDTSWFRFAVEQQGNCRIIKQLEDLA